MVPKLHPKGKSFKGAAAYLLHDKGGKTTNERVAWTETRNLITRNPEAAWRVMAATAKDQERLKRLADVKSTGRKSTDSALHLTLSWHPTEKVTREEMVRAADEAITTLGAADRQVMLVCHNDEPHPHVHLLINRVSPADGKMLSSSNEKLALSRWAEGYEKEQGNIVCPERVKNNERRQRGDFVRGEADRPREEAESKGQKNRVPTNVRLQQRQKDAELAARTRAMRARHKAEWNALRERLQKEKTSLRGKLDELFPRYRLHLERAYLDAKTLHDSRQRRKLLAFCRDEKTVLGRMVHRLQSIDFPALLRNGARERQTLREAFQCLISSEARIRAFKEKQRQETREFEKKQAKNRSRGHKRIFIGWRVRKVKVGERFSEARAELWNRQKKEKESMDQAWKARKNERIRVTALYDERQAINRSHEKNLDNLSRERERPFF